jgi:hypothetical protein
VLRSFGLVAQNVPDILHQNPSICASVVAQNSLVWRRMSSSLGLGVRASCHSVSRCMGEEADLQLQREFSSPPPPPALAVGTLMPRVGSGLRPGQPRHCSYHFYDNIYIYIYLFSVGKVNVRRWWRYRSVTKRGRRDLVRGSWLASRPNMRLFLPYITAIDTCPSDTYLLMLSWIRQLQEPSNNSNPISKHPNQKYKSF